MQQGNKCAAKPRGRHVSSSRGGRKRNASRAGGKTRAGRRTANRPTQRAPRRDVKGHTQTRPAHTTDGARGKKNSQQRRQHAGCPFPHTTDTRPRQPQTERPGILCPAPQTPHPAPTHPHKTGVSAIKKSQTGRDGGQTQLRPLASPPPPPLPPTPSSPPPNIPGPSRPSGRSPPRASPKPTPPPPRQHRRSPPLPLPPPPPHATPPNRPTAGSVGWGGRWLGHRDGAPRWRDPAHRSPPPGAAARWPAQPQTPAHHPSTPPVPSPTLFPRCRSPPRSPSTPPTPPPPRLPPPTPRALPRQHRRCCRWRPPTEGAARPTRRRRCGTGGRRGGAGEARRQAHPLSPRLAGAPHAHYTHARWGGRAQRGGRRGGPWEGGGPCHRGDIE